MSIGNFPAFSFFTISGFQMPKCIGPLALGIPDPPNPDFPYCYSFPGFPPFRDFGTSIPEMRGSPIFRICEMSNPDMPMDFPIGIFPELLDFCHASSYDGWSSIILRFHEIKCRNAPHPVLLIPEVPTCEMPTDS
jgi:hypothetical protein